MGSGRIRIELLGMAGAGKSTIGQALPQALDAAGVDAGYVDCHLARGSKLSALAAAPRVAMVGLVASRGRLALARRQLALLPFIRVASDHEGARVLVLDEGPVKRLSGIYFRGEPWRPLLGHLPSPDVVVLVEAPVDLCLERLRGRERPSGIDGLGDGQARGFLAGDRDSSRAFAGLLGVPVVEVDGASDAAVGGLVDVVMSLVSEGRLGP